MDIAFAARKGLFDAAGLDELDAQRIAHDHSILIGAPRTPFVDRAEEAVFDIEELQATAEGGVGFAMQDGVQGFERWICFGELSQKIGRASCRERVFQYV